MLTISYTTQWRRQMCVCLCTRPAHSKTELMGLVIKLRRAPQKAQDAPNLEGAVEPHLPLISAHLNDDMTAGKFDNSG